MNVYSSEEFNFNSHRYEQQLSTFGKKVLSALVKKWNRDKIRNESTPRFRNTPAQSSWATSVPRTHNRKVLTFLNNESPIQTSNSDLPDITHFEVPETETVDVTHPQGSRTLDNNYNNIISGPLPCIPRSNELVQTLDAKPSNHSNVTTHDLLRTANENYFTEDIAVDSGVEKPLNDNTKEANVDWQNMFDTELISDGVDNETGIHNDINTVNTFTLVANPQETKDMNPNEVINKKINRSFEIKTKEYQDSKKRKAQSKITDAVPKKVKKPTSETKNTIRKQKYTTAVKNWLDNADPNHSIDDNTNNASDTVTINNSKIEIISERDKLIPSKKTVQTQLANKDGIMKFRKPKDLDIQATAENVNKIEPNNTNIDNSKLNKPRNIVNTTEDITNIKQNTSPGNIKKVVENKPSMIKEKKTKRKFVTPIKSQIPVKDVSYNITHVNVDVSEDSSCVIDSAVDLDVFAVLVYSNGFSQLNKHHTEDVCEPTGLLLNIEEQFYYFKGFHQNFKNVLKQFLEKNKIICFDGKSILIYLKSQYDLDTHNCNVIDVQIGACILEPDSSIENFSEVQKVVSISPEYTVATECHLQKTAWYTTVLRGCAGNLIRLLKENYLWTVFTNIEMKVLPIIADMEYQGVEVDTAKLKSMEDRLLTRMKAVEQQCYQAAGKPFHIHSPLQVRTIVYEELQLDAKGNVRIRETIAQGAKSTSEAMLRSLVSVHPLPKLILEYRHLHKAHATFLAGVAQHVRDGIVRPTWVQTAAVTGRIASSNPNLQAIPKAPFSLTLFPEGDARNESLLFRSVYTSPAGWRVVAADFKQVECRVWATLAADAQLLDALTAPDLFRQLAQLWLKKPLSEISPGERERTKRMVYATLYGAGCRTLMDILGLGYEQTLAVIASFNRTFPCLKSFGSSVVSACGAAGGEVRTASGRRRRFPHIASADADAGAALTAQAERQAINFLIQGSAADLCKLAMVQSVEQLRAANVDFRLVLQIHDELVFHVRNEHLDLAAGIIKRAMEGCGRSAAGGMAGPLPVQLAVGPNWAQITEYIPK